MIIDPNLTSVSNDHETCIKEFDVCIIGAGAIGISMALYLESISEFKIAILELGTLSGEEAQADAVINTGDIASGLAGSRSYGFGGSTTIWGGQALKFDDLDFTDRPWIEHAEWPINQDDIKPYYRFAEEMIGVGGIDFGTDICSKDIASSDSNSLNRLDIELSYSKFSPEPNFQHKYQPRIERSTNIVCYLNAEFDFHQNEDDEQIKSLRVSLKDQAPFDLKANHFVLCCGGIDSTVELLSSKIRGLDDLPIGRYYHDHIGIYGAQLMPRNISKFRDLFATRIKNGVKCVPKLKLSDACQHKHKLVNINANIEVQTTSQDPLSMMRTVYSKVRKLQFNLTTAKLMFKLLMHPKELISACYELFVKKRVFLPRDATFFLIANIESPPRQDSYIKILDPESRQQQSKNRKPHAEINWTASKESKNSAAHFYTAVKEALETTGIADLILKKSMYENNRDWLKDCYGLYHHMGALRMSKTPEYGVVDTNCRVHSVPNLYIAGTSVLPTGSASNPTFTALAIALRLCDHICNQPSKT